jgi:hypothetical protein
MLALQPITAVTTDDVQSHNSAVGSNSSSVSTTDAAIGCYSESGSALLLANMLVIAAAASSTSSSSSSTAPTTALPDCVLSLEQHVQSLWPLVQKAASGGSDSEIAATNGHATAAAAASTGEQSSEQSSASAAQGVLRYVSQLGAALAHHLAQQAQQDIAQLQVHCYTVLSRHHFLTIAIIAAEVYY